MLYYLLLNNKNNIKCMNLNNILEKIKNIKGLPLKNKIGALKDTEIKINDKRNRPILILRLLSFLIIFLLISGTMFTMIFVYNSINASISQIDSIIAYQSESIVELIEFGKLDKIEKYWQEKEQFEMPTLKRDPFSKITIYNNISVATSTTD